MNLLDLYPFAHALGWTLIHFCWQGTVVALLLWCVLGAMGANSPAMRYAAACCSLTLMVVLPLATFARLAVQDYRLARIDRVSLQQTADIVVQAGLGAAPLPWTQRFMVELDHGLPWLLAAWSAGVALLLLRLGGGLLATRTMRREGTAAPVELEAIFNRILRSIGMDRAVQLLCSIRVQAPTVIGWLHPIVLLPAACLTGLEAGQIEALLRHELAHIRRHDYLVNILQSVVEILLFYHPAVWWVSRQIRKERECCCDELAIGAGGDVLSYARALSWLEEQRSVAPQLALAANGGVLKMRIQRLLGRPERSATSQVASIAVLVLLALAGLGVAGRMAYGEAHGAGALAAAAQQAMPAPAAAHGTITPAGSPSQEHHAGDEPSPEARFGGAAGFADEERLRDLSRAIDRAADEYTTALKSIGAQQKLSEEDRHRLTEAQHELDESIKQWQQLNMKRWQAEQKASVKASFADAEARIKAAQAAMEELNSPKMRQQLKEAATKMTQADGKRIKEQMEAAREAMRKVDQDQIRREMEAAKAQFSQLNSPEFRKQFKGAEAFQLDSQQLRERLEQMKKSSRLDSEAMREQIQQQFAKSLLLAQAAEPAAPEAATAASKSAGSFRVSSGVMQGLLIAHPAPVYPAVAKAAHVQGVVVLHALVSKEGKVENIQVISGPPMLTQSAIDAVRQWTYKPVIVSGRPVAVDTTINVNYTFGEPSALAGPGQADLQDPIPPTDKSGQPVYRIGGQISQPELIHQVAPEITAEAKKAKFIGVVLVGLIVNEEGQPEDVHIVRGIGMGLNDKALEAVKQYKFKPAMESGKPVAVALNVEVNFQVF